MDTKILEEIGLTKSEIKAYLALIKLGSTSTGPLSKQSQVSRSKLYAVLDKLEKKGIVSHIEKDNTAYFQAVEPAKIINYIEDKEKDFKRLMEDFKGFLPQLNNYYENSENVQKVCVYQDFGGLCAAYEHIYLKLKHGGEYYCFGIAADQTEEQNRYWEKDHMRRAKAGIKCRLLFNQDTDKAVLTNRNGFPLCDARYMPTNIKPPAYFNIFSDTTIISVPSHTAISIEIISQNIADSFKSYFDDFWRKTKPFTASSK